EKMAEKVICYRDGRKSFTRFVFILSVLLQLKTGVFYTLADVANIEETMIENYTTKKQKKNRKISFKKKFQIPFKRMEHINTNEQTNAQCWSVDYKMSALLQKSY
ncbi:hypothetical protein DOY81_001197, partial [Sarcophaga bullata]